MAKTPQECFAEVRPVLVQSLIDNERAVRRTLNTFAVFDEYGRVAWQVQPEGRIAFAAFDYKLRPVCMSNDVYADRLDDMVMCVSYDARDLHGLECRYEGATVRRLDVYLNEQLRAGERLLADLEAKLGGTK